MKRHTHLLLPLLVMLGGSVTVGWLTVLGLKPLSTQVFAVLGPLPQGEFGAVLGSRISRAHLQNYNPLLIAASSLMSLDPAHQALVRRAHDEGRSIIVTEADQSVVDELIRVTGSTVPLTLIFNAGEPSKRPAVGLNPTENGVSTYELHTASTGQELEDEVSGLMRWARQYDNRIPTHWKPEEPGTLNLARVARHLQEVDQFATPLGFVENRNTHTAVYSCADDAYFVLVQSDLHGAITGLGPTVLQTFQVDRNNALEIPGLSIEQALPHSTEFATDYRTGANMRFPGSVDYFDGKGEVVTASNATYITDHSVRSAALRIDSRACLPQAFPEIEYTAQSDPERGPLAFAVSWIWRIPGSAAVPNVSVARMQFLTSDDANRSGFSLNTLGMSIRFPKRRCARDGRGEGDDEQGDDRAPPGKAP